MTATTETVISALIWLALFAAVGLYELHTLRSRDDLHHPLTWHLRRLLRRPWFVILAIGFWVWLPLHLIGVVP
jgi:hypothetical protein